MASAISTGSRIPWHRGGGSVHRRFPLPAKADMSWRSLKRKYRRSNKRTDAPFLSYLRSDMRKENKKIHPLRRMDFFLCLWADRSAHIDIFEEGNLKVRSIYGKIKEIERKICGKNDEKRPKDPA